MGARVARPYFPCVVGMSTSRLIELDETEAWAAALAPFEVWPCHTAEYFSALQYSLRGRMFLWQMKAPPRVPSARLCCAHKAKGWMCAAHMVCMGRFIRAMQRRRCRHYCTAAKNKVGQPPTSCGRQVQRLRHVGRLAPCLSHGIILISVRAKHYC